MVVESRFQEVDLGDGVEAVETTSMDEVGQSSRSSRFTLISFHLFPFITSISTALELTKGAIANNVSAARYHRRLEPVRRPKPEAISELPADIVLEDVITV